MLTKNGRIIITPNGTSARKLKNSTGSSYNSMNSNTYNSLFNQLYLKVGNGTTAPTQDDYDIENEISEGITITPVSKSSASTIEYDNPPSILFVNTLITNDLENDIEITEITMWTTTNNLTPSSANQVMLTRTVLAEPFVLESGKTYQLRVDIN